jgi:hypothetical protein
MLFHMTKEERLDAGAQIFPVGHHIVGRDDPPADIRVKSTCTSIKNASVYVGALMRA